MDFLKFLKYCFMSKIHIFKIITIVFSTIAISVATTYPFTMYFLGPFFVSKIMISVEENRYIEVHKKHKILTLYCDHLGRHRHHKIAKELEEDEKKILLAENEFRIIKSHRFWEREDLVENHFPKIFDLLELIPERQRKI